MPRFPGRKPFHQEIFSRQIGEIRSMLQALELRDVFEEGENRPLMDVYETGGEIVLEFDLPGFSVEDVSLIQDGPTLTLEAQRPREQAGDGARFICLERSFGRFRHAVHIPVNIDANAITAEYRRGVLRVRCPKITARRVPIKETTE
jgi:HSP20 family protein